MPSTAAFTLLFLASTAAQATDLRVTHAEGHVVTEPNAVRTSAGRVELVLSDGTLIHLDADTRVHALEGKPFTIAAGRLIVRTGDRGLVLEAGAARLDVDPASVGTVTVDTREGRLLVAVRAGAITLRTGEAAPARIPEGASGRLAAAHAAPSVTITSASAADAFSLWSDERTAAAGGGPFHAASATELPGAPAPPPGCADWSSWPVPCWAVPYGNPYLNWGPPVPASPALASPPAPPAWPPYPAPWKGPYAGWFPGLGLLSPYVPWLAGPYALGRLPFAPPRRGGHPGPGPRRPPAP